MPTIRTFALTLALALVAQATTAAAADSRSQDIKRHAPAGITDAFYACVDKAGSDTNAAANCLTDEHARQDKRLNTTYKNLLSKLAPKAKDQLIHAERAWLKFQEANGSLESSVYGGEAVGNLQATENAIFRICERANALDDYLFVVNLQ
ncbi:lysozyme inhibitor LprI family protein [Dyella ginsengisoli]|uniref:lysozyme inhibitor LprI family protein n=1 Tax=Dyella ginsengisoli TaxID=363848 RepID=UPI0003493C64|nr:lysozyme inhibitor LprI family protein [Dyella ginsengisoli]